jgi:hypothetical protein
MDGIFLVETLVKLSNVLEQVSRDINVLTDDILKEVKIEQEKNKSKTG